MLTISHALESGIYLLCILHFQNREIGNALDISWWFKCFGNQAFYILWHALESGIYFLGNPLFKQVVASAKEKEGHGGEGLENRRKKKVPRSCRNSIFWILDYFLWISHELIFSLLSPWCSHSFLQNFLIKLMFCSLIFHFHVWTC